jgi:UV DNA damage endonuclease
LFLFRGGIPVPWPVCGGSWKGSVEPRVGQICDVGFACVTSDGSCTTSHTFRLANLSPERLEAAVEQNVADLHAILGMMRKGPLRLFRIGSSFVPFASHPAMDFDWRAIVGPEIEAIGRSYPEFRFSFHPGQYNVLNSPNPEVVACCIAELEYSCSVLDLMGLDARHKVVLHGGGIYGDRESATERLARNAAALPERIRRRLVLEHDERHFNLAEITRVGEAAGIPVVFDIHHHSVNACEEETSWLRRAMMLWDCRPKVHISSQKPGARPGAHDDYVFPEDLPKLLQMLPIDVDLMVEAKAKEKAALKCWSDLQELRGLTSRSEGQEDLAGIPAHTSS